MTRGSIISLGIANPVFRPNTDEEGVFDNDGFVDHEKVEIGVPSVQEKSEADTASTAPTELKASLNLGHAVSLAVGQTIGSGIFVSPNDVVKQVGSIGMSLTIWLISGTLSMCGALTFCELGTMFKRSGGEYQYIKAAYGKLASFLYLWVCGVIRNGMGCAAISLTFAHYFMDLFMDEDDPGFVIAKKSAATAAILIIIAVNVWSTKIGLWMQNIFTVLKLGALSVLIIMGIYFICAGKTQNINKNWFEGTTIDFPKWTNAFFASLWAYSGWNCINMMSGEIKNSTKTVPRALVITNVIMISIYLVANIAYHTILPIKVLRNERAIAVVIFWHIDNILTLF
ncbi:b(0,+)-type amino acid transporter 1-like [Bolinopsis microptera]|uniref:b(0,+)-type amino acid transporter 1-like n=1 Tax=Bolinopsis microptera TaxID=2820187 RepID=UPI0030798554